MVGRVHTIEQALDLAGFAHYNLYLFLFYGWIVVVMTFEMFSSFYLMPNMAIELNATKSQQDLITQLLTIGLFGSSNIWSYIADTRGRKNVLKIALIISFIFGTFAAFSPHWIVFAVFKCISAAAVAGIFASSFPLLIECTPKARRGAVIILTTSTFLVALGTMAVLSLPILSFTFSGYIPGAGIYFNSWRLLCLLLALPSIFGALGVQYFFESPKYLLTVDKDAEALGVLRRIYEINSRTSAGSYQVDMLILDEDNISTVEMNCLKSFWTRLVTILKKPRLRYFSTVMKALVGSYVSAYCYIELTPIIASAFMSSKTSGNTHLTVCEMIRTHHNSTNFEKSNDRLINSFAMTMMFAVGIALAVFNVVINSLVNYVSKKRIILGVQVLVTIAALCINFSPYGVLTAILFLCVLSGVFNLGLIYTYVVDIFPSFVMSMAVCLTAVAGLGPAQLAATFIKRFVNSNCEVVFYIVTGVSLICVVIIVFLPSDETLSENRKILKTPVPQGDDDYET